MNNLTYKEWRKIGYQVMKGEHSHSRNKKGDPVFTHRQVKAMCSDLRVDPRLITAQSNALFNSAPRFVKQRVIDCEDWDQDLHDLYNYDGYFDDIGDR